jgi:hypothetical protein
MAVGIGASGQLGLAFESTPGTYVAPTIFVPFESESLNHQQETVWRRPIRQAADIVGAVDGNAHVSGDIEMELFGDALVYFLYASRMSLTKGGSAPYSYEYKTTAAAVPNKTLSITVVKNGEAFGFVGCVTSSLKISTADGMAKLSVSIVGQDEATQTEPTATWAGMLPYGAGAYDVQIPTSSSVLDADTFEFTYNSNAEPQFRLKNTGRGAQFVKFGENETSLSVERDFDGRTDFDAYKALTAQSITIEMANDTDDAVTILMPVAIKDSYEISLGGQGDLVRASVSYMGTLHSDGTACTITILSNTNIATT